MTQMTLSTMWKPMVAVVLMAAPVPAQAGEQKVSIDQVPAVVKSAIIKRVADGKLVDIGRYDKDGKTVYEIEMIDPAGAEHDVTFGADGAVLEATNEGAGDGQEPGNDADQDPEPDEGEGATFQDDFGLEDRKLATTGRSRFFVLEAGYQLVLEGKDGDEKVNLTITVLDETRKVGGFDTRVVEERETVDDEIVEVSRNFLAIDPATGSVFYFGEEVDIYEDGKVVRHEGAWLHGENGARAGMLMPGEPLLGAAYQQETAPGVAMDRARVAATNVTLATPSGIFKGCLKVREENPLDGDHEFKLHAPGIGLVQDERLVLVQHGFRK